MRLFLTGGAGFIGSAVCRHLVSDLGHEVVVIDKLTYAANLASLAPISASPLYRLEQVDICDAPRIAQLFETYQPDGVIHLAAESHVDRSITGSRVFVDTNVIGTFTLLEAARAYLAGADKALADRFRFVHVSTDEVYGSLGADGLFVEDTAYDPELALFGHQGRVRSPGQGLAPDLRPAGDRLQLFQQLRALPLPGKADPADHPGGAGWRAPARLRRRLQHPRLAVRRGPRPRAGPDFPTWPARRDLQHRRPQRAAEHRCGQRDVRADGPATTPPAGPHRRLITYRRRPPGPRPALRHRRQQAGDRAGLARAGDLRDRHREDRRLVSGPARLVGAAAQQGLLRRAPRPDAGLRREDFRDRCERPGRAVAPRGGGGRRRAGARLGRPAHLDLTRPDTVARAIAAFEPDLVINPAAYTAVDRAESEPELAFAVNRDGAGAVAAAPRRGRARRSSICRRTMCSTGPRTALTSRPTPPAPPASMASPSWRASSRSRPANPRHVILRTAWVYAPFGANFVRTMLRLAGERELLTVVDDQVGCPTYAPDIAAAILAIAHHLGDGWRDANAGVTNCAGPDAMTWCGFARAIMSGASVRGARGVPVEAIITAQFPTPARRPANSRLDCGRLADLFDVRLPASEDALGRCLDRLLGAARSSEGTTQ